MYGPIQELSMPTALAHKLVQRPTQYSQPACTHIYIYIYIPISTICFNVSYRIHFCVIVAVQEVLPSARPHAEAIEQSSSIRTCPVLRSPRKHSTCICEAVLSGTRNQNLENASKTSIASFILCSADLNALSTSSIWKLTFV